LALVLWSECIVGGYFGVLPQATQARQPTQQAAAMSRSMFQPGTEQAGWVYADRAGHRAADVVRFARLASNVLPSVNGEPAPTGATTGSLEITSSRHAGNTVLVSFARYLSHCPAGACQVRAAFDQTEPEPFPAQDASTAHATRLRLGNANRFAQRLSVAHELTLYAALGNRQVILNFSVDGYQMALRSVEVRYASLATFRA
jgi:hypothetical protein